MTAFSLSFRRTRFWGALDGSLVEISEPEGARLPAGDVSLLATAVQPMWRRRLNPFGRISLQTLSHALEALENPRIVFASRHGDMERTVRLIEQVARDGTASPADFSMAVHNAVAGIASINWRITASHTAIAAGEDTMVCALTEAFCQLAEAPSQPVVLVYIDLPLPDIYAACDDPDAAPVAIATVLENTGSEPGSFKATYVQGDGAGARCRQHAQIFCDFALDAGQMSAGLIGRNAGWRLVRNV